MDNFLVLQRKVLRTAGLLALFLILEGFLYQQPLVALGFLLGSIVSCLGFLHLASTCKQVTENHLEKKKVTPFIIHKYSLRTVVVFAVLLLSWQGGNKLFLATAIGLLVVKGAIFLEILVSLCKSYSSNYLSRIRRR